MHEYPFTSLQSRSAPILHCCSHGCTPILDTAVADRRPRFPDSIHQGRALSLLCDILVGPVAEEIFWVTNNLTPEREFAGSVGCSGGMVGAGHKLFVGMGRLIGFCDRLLRGTSEGTESLTPCVSTPPRSKPLTPSSTPFSHTISYTATTRRPNRKAPPIRCSTPHRH